VFYYVQWDYAIVSFDTIKSSKPTAELQSESGEMGFELNDAPNLKWLDDTLAQQLGPIFREHFEDAKAAGITVHAILGRYDDVTKPVTEFCFAGSMNPRDYSVTHRRVPPNARRSETLKCTFSPAERLNVPLGQISWADTDMFTQCEFIASIVSEPESSYLANFKSAFDVSLSIFAYPLDGSDPPLKYTQVLSYGTDMHSRAAMNPNPMLDSVGNTRTFPAGNWGVKLSTVVQKVCDASGITWDGNLNKSVKWPRVVYNGTATAITPNQYEEQGFTDDPILNFNLVFGYNWWDGTTFKSPATWDVEMTTLDVLRGIAIQLGCWCDLTSAFDADGQPILTFVTLDATTGAMPTMEDLPDSSEDVPITDSDGVKVTRRGFDGAIIAPSNALKPVEIQVPFGTHAMGYLTAPAFDFSRLTLNSNLPFGSQWKCGHRGAFTSDGLADDGAGHRVPSLNPDGWVVGSFLFDYNGTTSNTHFPITLDTNSFGGPLIGFHDDAEPCYHATGWGQCYVVHATYESDTLTDDEKRDREQHEMLAHAILFGRAIRGQRKQLQVSFRGVIAPSWAAIKLTQTYNFTPVTTELTYRLVSIERDIIADEIHTLMEEVVSAATLPITWRIEGKENSGNGSIGGNAASGAGNPVTSDWDVIRPAQLTTNTNNWAAGQTGKSVVYVNASAQFTLTGITNGKANSFIVLVNNGAKAITLMNENAASAAANRFIIPGVSGLKSLGPNGIQWLLYDSTAQRWRLLPS
jgi:hypothetical protein